jgi:hypothetical protein
MSEKRAVASVLTVERGACRRVRVMQQAALTIRSGRAWVTVERDAADYWLAPGEALPVAAGERVWIGGWNEAVCCELPFVGRRRDGAVAAIAARARRWIRLLPRRAWS